jgi:hypothetical protein
MRSEDDKIKQLERENMRLKIALGEAVMVRDVLETIIEEVDKHYQTDVKKNFGQQQLKGVTKKRVKE